MSRTSIRLQYLLRRACSIRLLSLWESAGRVRHVARSPRWVIILDMLWCSVRYDMGFRDYAAWDVRLLRSQERKTWMTHPKSHVLTKLHNDPVASVRFEDKISFHTEFADVTGREWIDARRASDFEVADFVRRHRRVLAKPVAGERGMGITAYSGLDVRDPAEFRSRVVAAGTPLIEQALQQHPAMASLDPDSMNTLRMITYYEPDRDRVHLVSAVLRIGNGGITDNFAAGGLYTFLEANGIALYPGVDKDGGVFTRHPRTGAPIGGFQVPHYREVLDLLEDVARRVTDVRYVGWDIAITPEGPVLIEGNHNSSVFQPKPSASGVRIGMLQQYREAMSGLGV